MLLHHGEDADRLFRADWSVAVHLELEDTYSKPEEDEPFRKFLAGEPDDYAWFAGWASVVRDATASGKVVRRVRVVTEPHTDYTRFALHIAQLNAEAGEDVRYLPRHTVDPTQLGGDDWWIFDDNLVAFSVFTPTGAGAGLATTTDPVIAAHIRTIRDRLWPLAIPSADYAVATAAQ
ncbi:hypothetical protein GFY24_24930 [Nocardia sp. SYP-A9097]|uniref:DUF6879 family protein n=1 Tax=Nocardia sp. SYP-A9097 TaxID=2663237 RepID=UPI00129A485E|nr:DUF6879 family protein [Nocardia sp. SYP-A9097]MRH90646.1 hypothetical protein [Nocardia sp. SYP-A9097]